ncbi:signal peptidase I [Caldibacillus lycopersici]|uniref:Signal peptidase I n=2 Tax=Perspicuibacillus lycopersici TaxID=1325689 RepID=A0AAE3IQE7_9BACI|nr:signal peptidase I [Perspicuibacillus lycopersici]MCU9612481.1 signal peptidase I [Perspicuibacillus lycopersici]
MGKFKSEGIEWLKALVMGFIIFLIIQMFFFTNYVVEGESMTPTLQDGDKLVVNKISYRFSDINRFDVVVFHANDKEDYVKRVIGLPGDEITYQDDHLYINNKFFNEPYLDKFKKQVTDGLLTKNFTLQELTGQMQVPEGYLFVLGDNRKNSFDSRQFGFVSMNEVVGKVNLRYWPINEWAVSFQK